MPRTCTVCRHASLPDIDRALVRGDSLRDIARQFDVSKDAVRRHKTDHLPKTLGKALEDGETGRVLDLLEEMLCHEATDNLAKQAKPPLETIFEEGRDASDGISEGGTTTDIKGVEGGAMLLPKAARDERQRIRQAFQRLGVPQKLWSPLVGPEPKVRQGGHTPGEPFLPPIYNPYEQTPEEWRRLAHADLDEYLDEFLKSCQACVNIGLDEPVALPKRRREVNLTIDQRYECAALRLLRKSWKEIGARYSNGSTPEQDERAIGAVKKSAMAIIRAAGLRVKGNKDTSS